MDYLPDRIERNIVLSCEMSYRCSVLMLLSDTSDRCICEFGIKVEDASGPSSLFGSISDVIGLSTKEEVFWVDAVADITSMAHTEAVWYRAIDCSPRNAMYSQTFRPIFINDSIAIRIPEANPKPTRRRLLNATPQSFLQCASRCSHE
jgi:hypothetical protein